MPSNSLLKKVRFKQTDTSAEPTPVAIPTTYVDDSAVVTKIAAEYAGEVKHDYTEQLNNLSEVEANRRLNKFRQEHSFDPNLPEAAFEAIDSATGLHDHKGEAALVGELVEDSPYPEARRNPSTLV